jgi:hypothetical protein
MFQRLAANTAPLRRKAPNVASLDRNSPLWFPWLTGRPNAPVSRGHLVCYRDNEDRRCTPQNLIPPQS